MREDLENIVLALQCGDYKAAVWLCDYLKDQPGTVTERLALSRLTMIAHDYRDAITAAKETCTDLHPDDPIYRERYMDVIESQYMDAIQGILHNIIGDNLLDEDEAGA